MTLTYEGITTQYIREIAQRPPRRAGSTRRPEGARTETLRAHASETRNDRRRGNPVR